MAQPVQSTKFITKQMTPINRFFFFFTIIGKQLTLIV